MAGREVKKISCSDVSGMFGGPKWRCHVYTADGRHYVGEGSTKEKATENALEVKRAND